MKLILLGALALAMIAPPAEPTGRLRVDLRTEAEGGRIAVAVYRDAESLRRNRGAMRTMLVDRSGPVTTVVISDLPPGRYAIAAFHDMDGDGRLSTWPIGMPKEAYGFSNNARGRFGPPTFEAAAVQVSPGGSRVDIRLH